MGKKRITHLKIKLAFFLVMTFISSIGIALTTPTIIIKTQPIAESTIQSCYFPITITENSGNTLDNYAVPILLDTNNFNYWNLLTSVIYFTQDSQGTTPLYYYIETYDPNNRILFAWVKIPTIPANGQVTVYMWSCTNTNSYQSYNDPTQVFPFFDDFTTDTLGTNWDNTYFGLQTNDYDYTFGTEAYVQNSKLILNKTLSPDSEAALISTYTIRQNEWNNWINSGGYYLIEEVVYYPCIGYSRPLEHVVKIGGVMGWFSWHVGDPSNQCNAQWVYGYYYRGNFYEYTANPASSNTWVRVQIYFGQYGVWARAFDENTGTLLQNWVNLIPASILPTRQFSFGFSQSMLTGTTGSYLETMYIERVRVLKLITPSPTVSIGDPTINVTFT